MHDDGSELIESDSAPETLTLKKPRKLFMTETSSNEL